MSEITNDRRPHVGVRGDACHGDDFLAGSKEEIGRLANLLWGMTLVGNPAPIVSDQHWRMRSPQVGDRVVALDATYESPA